MGAYYTTKDGDRLDVVAQDYFGFQAVAVEEIVKHPQNHKLVRIGLVLPAGVEIYLPDITRPNQVPKQQIKLWDAWEGAS